MLETNEKCPLNIKKIGILGGGQLAFLLAKAAFKKGLDVYVYAQNGEEPACTIATKAIIGLQNDELLLESFFNQCDVVSLESEFFTPSLLEKLESKTGTKVYPTLNAYSSLYSKENQKKFFKKFQIPVVKYANIKNREEFDLIDFEGPYMVKLSTGGYDGYGNFFVQDRIQLEKKILELSSRDKIIFDKTFIVEQFIQIKNEFASILFKSNNSSLVLPPCQTFQEDSICKLVKFPAKMHEKQYRDLMNIMKRIENGLDGHGVFAFEFFEDTKGNILVNEAAPRVHNSYHFSMEAFEKNQFDLFLNTVLGEKLESPKQCHAFVSMVNILGQSTGENYDLKIPKFLGDYKYNVHMYGKKMSRVGRKMGHVTLYGETQNFDFAKKINKEYVL